MSDFLKSAVDKALQCETGRMNLFLLFLLGLSLESNQTLLRCLLTQASSTSYSKEDFVEYIKEKIRKNSSPEKTILLFHCLNELNEHSILQEVQTYLDRQCCSDGSGDKLCPTQCSAVAFILLNSGQELDEFDLKKYHSSEKCFLRLVPVVQICRKVSMRECNLTKKSCAALASALCSHSSSLIELDLSCNKLGNSGVKLLCEGLGNPQCKLEKLGLESCCITEEGCADLVSALKSNPSHLRELNLQHNKPGESGVTQLSDILKNPHYKLDNLHI